MRDILQIVISSKLDLFRRHLSAGDAALFSLTTFYRYYADEGALTPCARIKWYIIRPIDEGLKADAIAENIE